MRKLSEVLIELIESMVLRTLAPTADRLLGQSEDREIDLRMPGVRDKVLAFVGGQIEELAHEIDQWAESAAPVLGSEDLDPTVGEAHAEV